MAAPAQEEGRGTEEEEASVWAWSWGAGTDGQLGNGGFHDHDLPQPLLLPPRCRGRVSFVAGGGAHAIALTNSGQLFMCGDGSFGQLGTGDNHSKNLPFEVAYFNSRHIEKLAFGMRHSLVLLKDNSVYGFGSARRGQIGRCVSRNQKSYNVPRLIDGFPNSGQIFTIGVYRHQKCDIPESGNSVLQQSKPIATSTTHDETSSLSSLEKVPFIDGEHVVQIASGTEHSALVTYKGTVFTWGWGEHGQLGLGDTLDQVAPQRVNLDGEDNVLFSGWPSLHRTIFYDGANEEMERHSDGSGGGGGKIRIGVCVMEKKIIIFGDKVILEDPVERRDYPNQELNYFVEEDDFIEIHGKRFCKPFVEKPIDGTVPCSVDPYRETNCKERLPSLQTSGEGPGLLRLHSTYRHDLKIYSSDEGRVQMSAAAFAKGLLDLEGELTPILVSLVSKDSSMLDGLQDGTTEINEAKVRLHYIITSSNVVNCKQLVELPWMVDGAKVPTNAAQLLTELAELTKQVTAQVKILSDDEDEKVAINGDSPSRHYDQAKALGKAEIDMDRITAGLPCGNESFLLMFARWKKLERDLYNERKKRFDTTQIPDIYDSCKNTVGISDDFVLETSSISKATYGPENHYYANNNKVPQILIKISYDNMLCSWYQLGKMILIDLHNTRREVVLITAAAESNTCNDPKAMPSAKRKERCHYEEVRNECVERFSSNKNSINLNDTHQETKYCLDPK
ncbi:hypothetical protein PR202_gb04573 [Eleusine coracana subsp. coracana]|uniref:Inositol hexakisphosphate and diphosphoinositol-pentakisphosphate kinase n=1 Tax=Eleusine coracana subsp. coracana TaxID=191504 RepID=A0AAV5E5P2_ELECO|nr:hypothetical protein PR202_gb04573 [Eleusine coracana subsp. coracana]